MLPRPTRPRPRLGRLLFCAPLLAPLVGRPAAAQPAAVRPAATQPAPGPVRIVSGPGNGCIAGAVELPPEGVGYQTMRMSRSHFWGHPSTVAALQLLGARARSAGLPTLYMNDLSRPRGGPTAGVHASHQTGLDADVSLDLSPRPALTLTRAQRDALDPPGLVAPDRRGVDPARWRPQHITLLRLAAGLPGLDRVLVNPAIKRQLCLEATGDRSWLRLIRPWYGHAAHMHLHFRCPANQPECRDQPPPPPGDGCDASLQWWFDQLDAPPPPPSPPRVPPPLPPFCQALLGVER